MCGEQSLCCQLWDAQKNFRCVFNAFANASTGGGDGIDLSKKTN